MAQYALKPADIKTYLNKDLEDTRDDASMVARFAAAVQFAEHYLSIRAIINEETEAADVPSGDRLFLSVGPLVEVDSITAVDDGGTETLFSDDDYYVVPGTPRSRGFVGLRTARSWPECRARQGLVVEYTAGYSATAEGVPAWLRDAILMLFSYLWRNRGSEWLGSGDSRVELKAVPEQWFSFVNLMHWRP